MFSDLICLYIVCAMMIFLGVGAIAEGALLPGLIAIVGGLAWTALVVSAHLGWRVR